MAAQYRNILLTGGTGFVGPLLARAVAHAWPDARRHLLAREGEPSPSPDWAVATGDLCNPASVESVIKRTWPDLVLHLAAQSSVAESIEGAETTWNVNCLGTFHIAAALARHAPEATVFFVSSADVYGAAFARSPVDESVAPEPLNAYARSKLAAEGLLADMLPKSARLICVRSFNHTGPRQDRRFVLPSFAAQIAAVEQGLQPPRILVGNLDAQRDFLDVNDVIEAYMVLLANADRLPTRALYNVASGRAQSIRSLLDKMLALAKTPCEIAIDPARMRPSDVPIASGDATRLREATGWEPVRPLGETLRELVEFWRNENTAPSPSIQNSPIITPDANGFPSDRLGFSAVPVVTDYPVESHGVSKLEFITYAQNFEDLMLYRALKDIERGFYIDVGAADPVYNSVTKAFVDRDWSGINIEPGARPFGELVKVRPGDINLNCAIGSDDGVQTLFSVQDDNELSTLEPGIAAQHKSDGWKVQEREIKVRSLSSICSEFVGNRTIHFLKVDAEGFEVQVLQGMDFTQWRPWIILAEAHEPERQSRHWEPWAKILTDNGYDFVYCDGLNRYYIAKEKTGELARSFEVPPNVYDNWIRSSELYCRDRVKKLEEQFNEAYGQAQTAWTEVKRLTEELDKINNLRREKGAAG